MKALVIEKTDQAARLVVRDVSNPVPLPGEALVKVKLAGICRTDQELVKGYLDFSGIPGHEFVGEVVEVNSKEDPDRELIGQRVVGEINCGCGKCQWCHAGLQRHCPHRTVLGIAGKDGAFAEFLTLPLDNLHVVADEIDDKTAVFTEPAAAALEIFEQVKISPHSKVLVIGDGKLGLLISRVLQLHGCEVDCIGGGEHKIALLQQWGINAVHHSHPIATRYQFAVEASGTPEGFNTAIKSLHPRGTLILKSTYAGKLQTNAAPWVINEIQIVGSRCGPFAPALNLLRQNMLDVDSLITAIFPFKDALSAFEAASASESLKVLLDFSKID
ncbi:alcohol dehydrogenase catalytic domain-containing protein [bacterium]|nr:alcohol dehydrogenase catalytic domain-containing protein [bacterium]